MCRLKSLIEKRILPACTHDTLRRMDLKRSRDTVFQFRRPELFSGALGAKCLYLLLFDHPCTCPMGKRQNYNWTRQFSDNFLPFNGRLTFYPSHKNGKGGAPKFSLFPEQTPRAHIGDSDSLDRKSNLCPKASTKFGPIIRVEGLLDKGGKGSLSHELNCPRARVSHFARKNSFLTKTP